VRLSIAHKFGGHCCANPNVAFSGNNSVGKRSGRLGELPAYRRAQGGISDGVEDSI
jgi:hypothetical protein